MSKLCFVFLAVTLLATPPSRPALAAPAPSAADKKKARNLVRLAKRFIRKKQFQQAVDSFKQAYRYWPRKEIQFNIALVYLELRAKVKAYRALRIFLSQSKPGILSRLPAPLLRLRNEVGVLRVSTTVEGAEIYVAGERRAASRGDVVVLPGKHEVEIRKDGEVLEKKTLQVSGGATVVWESTAEKPRPRDVTPPVDPQPKPSTSGRKKLHWVWFVSAASVAVAAGLVVAGTGVKTMQLGDDYDAQPSRDLQKSGRRYKLATNVMIGVGSAAAVTAAVLAIFTRWKSKEKASAVNVVPGVTPGGASVSVDFSF